MSPSLDMNISINSKGHENQHAFTIEGRFG